MWGPRPLNQETLKLQMRVARPQPQPLHGPWRSTLCLAASATTRRYTSVQMQADFAVMSFSNRKHPGKVTVVSVGPSQWQTWKCQESVGIICLNLLMGFHVLLVWLTEMLSCALRIPGSAVPLRAAETPRGEAETISRSAWHLHVPK